MGNSTFILELQLDGEALALVTVKALDLEAARQRVRKGIWLIHRDPPPSLKQITIS